MIMTLLQALYDERVPLPSDFKAYLSALEDIEYFAIAPQVYTLLEEGDRLDRTPPFFRARLKELYRESLHRNLYIHLETDRLLDRFEAEGIDAIPLKGTRFAEKYFSRVGARPTSDIDVLIRAADVERARSCLRSLGFTIEGRRIEQHFHSAQAKPLPGSTVPLPVELHWSLLTERTSSFDVDELWEEAVPRESYKHIKELSDYHAFYMICLHGWKHALDSPKYFLDIAQMIHRAGGRLDTDRLFGDALVHRTHRRLTSTLSIVYNQFPHLHRVLPLPFQSRSAERLWWNYRAIRHKDEKDLRQYMRLAQYQWSDYDSPLHRLSATMQYLRSLSRR
ncbi:nucleotidyltransferase family protein [Paenibacillus sp.]|uniref:nucleotidyltransferase family protein n=1 Tax=Paenibacillus sp. TaxID=58172 RepID=UPI0028118FFF|nr:nucleotidyltransferase family protein [Paenibacillus sp.]